jgi:Peptidase M66
VPITQYVTVQPIQVCNDTGTDCAAVNLRNDFMQKVYEQAGVGVTFLPTVQYNNSTFMTTRVDDLNPTRIDEWRQLIRGPGHGQSTNSTTINAWFIEHLVDANNQVAYRGVSFINANGIIVTEDAVSDTLAHELGHNFGLNHTTFGVAAGDLKNLMTAGRTVPTTIADIAPSGQLLDQLNQQQIDKIRQPLFSVDLINAVASSPSQGSSFRVQLQGNNPSQSLRRMKVWYGAGDPVVHLLENADALIAAGCAAPAFQWSRNILADGTQEIVYDFSEGCFFAASSVGFSFLPFDGTGPVDRPDPFSFIFEFDDGTTSQAGFDPLTRTASSQDPDAILGFNGIPDYGPPADTLPEPLGFELHEIVAAVDAPRALTTTVVGLALILLASATARRRHESV